MDSSKVEYEYAGMKMALELVSFREGYELKHFQFNGNPGSALTKIFGTVKYCAKFKEAELETFVEALSERENGKVEVAKNMYVIRPDGALSMLRLEFPNSLETVPLPREASEKFIGLLKSVNNS
ncbi:hypothetical protein [Aurantivibrio plasticivorans]